MSEKIYGWLLRLYPSRFREAYLDQAMQLFRDRAQNERGFFRQLRLWLDLFTDWGASLVREYCSLQLAFAATSVPHQFEGAPSFYVVDDGPPRAGAFIFAGVVSVVVLSVFSTLVTKTGHRRLPQPSQTASMTSAGGLTGALRAQALPASHSDREVLAAGPPSASASVPVRQSDGERAGGRWVRARNDASIDAAEQYRVTAAVIDNLNEHYFDREVARKIADSLLAHEKNGDESAAIGGAAFAELLTRQVRDVSHDMHLEVVYSRAVIADRPLAPPPEVLERYRQAMEQENCMLRKVEVLPHNTGYLKLDSFPDPSICRSTAIAAMASLNKSSALIFDLRDNRGGYPAMVSLIAAYLFDHPEYMYNPREAPTEESWTRSPIEGNQLADKPVYVLTSATTLSGAEQFSYDLKMLKRAMIVGERTGGGAHAGVWHRIDDHFGIAIPELKAVNPYSKTDWEGTGVEPDVKVKAADALVTAEKLALQKK